MSCCPPAPPAAVWGGAFSESTGPESKIRPDENIDCYMARGGNVTGLQDDATEDPENLIANTAIPVTRDPTKATIAEQFKLTPNSTRTPTSWTVAVVPASSKFVMSSSGKLTATWNKGDADLGKSFTVTVKAIDGSGQIDSRSYTVAPTVGGEDDEVRLISPLPGGVVNSKFGPRVHPITKVMKPHTGIDMKMPDRSVKDVVAAADGEIVMCGGNPSSGYGLRVWIKHTSGSGKHLCTTTYNHLAKIYVTNGQKVMAGQKIGLEGSTGASTGNHLHFECKLPDGKFVDPEPLINGTLSVATNTDSAGNAVNPQPRVSKASLSEKQVEASTASCTLFGTTDYPKDPGETKDPVPPSTPPSTPDGLTDPFELAWFFTMKHEVGPHWTTSSPSDPDVSQGLCETKDQQRKCGYVNTPGYPGGETKFGIAQKPNPSVDVTTLTYADAKKLGYNNYWKSSPVSCSGKADRVAIMLFDMNYLHGGGNAKKIWADAGISSSSSDDKATQLAKCAALHAARVAFIQSLPNRTYTKGWLNRANDCMSYVQAL